MVALRTKCLHLVFIQKVTFFFSLRGTYFRVSLAKCSINEGEMVLSIFQSLLNICNSNLILMFRSERSKINLVNQNLTYEDESENSWREILSNFLRFGLTEKSFTNLEIAHQSKNNGFFRYCLI